MLTNEQLGLLFSEWRGNAARTEATYLINAFLINDTITTADFNLAAIEARITREAAAGPVAGAGTSTTPPYLATFSSLLHGALSLQYYYNQNIGNAAFIDNEQAVLSLMLSNLKRLYDNPTENPHARITEFILATYNWLDNCVLTTSNPANTRQALIALYRMLQFAQIKKNSLITADRALALGYSVDLTSLDTALPELLTKITHKIAELEARILPVDTAAVPREPELSIEGSISAQCNLVIEQPNLGLSDKLAQVKLLLTTWHTQIGQLITEKRSNETIQRQIPHALTLINAVEQNERKIAFKKYAIELIRENRDSFDVLIAQSSGDVQAAWETRLTALESSSVTSVAAYALSTVLFAPTLFYRSLLPDSARHKIEALAPDTIDSASKRELLALAESRLIELNTDLAASNARKVEKAHRVANNNMALKRQILVAPIERLEEIRAYTTSLQGLIVECEAVSARVTATQAKLQQIAGLNLEIDHFIHQHHGFMVTLSLLLSRVWQGFKTGTAAKVQHVNNLREQLANYNRTYEAFVEDGKRTISDAAIPTSMRAAFIAVLDSQTPRRPNAPSNPRLGLGEAYENIRTLFRNAKPEEPAAAGEGPRNDEAEVDGADGVALLGAGGPPIVARVV